MRWVVVILVISFVGGFYFTPPPTPGESDMHYIFAGRETWQSMTCSAVVSVCIIILFVGNMMRSDRDS